MFSVDLHSCNLPSFFFFFFINSLPDLNNKPYTARKSRNDPPRFLSRTKTGEKSLQFRKTQTWNEIPSEIKSCEFFNAFKKANKKFLIETTIEGT